MNSGTQIIPVLLTNGKEIRVEATIIGGEEDVAFNTLSFDGVTDTIEEVSHALVNTLQKVKPRKASVEFGLEIAIESGKLTAILLKGSGTASLKVTLEWGEG